MRGALVLSALRTTAPEGNAAREGIGETRSLTGRVGEDRRRTPLRNDDAGSGSRTALGTTIRRGALDRPRGPLPTRVQDLDPLPDSYHRAVDTGLAELGLRLAAEARRAIDDHVRLLLAWTAAINLTAIREPEAAARLHVLDSLAAVPVLRQRGIDRFLDLGSGGGYPGLPLAAALPADALLVEAVGKKARFLEVAATAAGLADQVDVAALRAEQLARDPAHAGRWPIVTARAVAALPRLVELALPLLEPGGALVAWKRGDLRGEIEAARPVVRALGANAPEVLPVAVTGLGQHCLVIVERRHRAGHGA
ncbi:MAG TPA: 16S rRNA (guanine(527)-N(7))-methyltransferase RsmG [Candidatus Limnocylindrales bacterium]|nr:16S rRNA (guanine(527)-N(7))-methyltransferase RsmG [Candidatus Limnocylindrales bacterium]